MGQFKPMVKMETTEPSVILKLAKGGVVKMKNGGSTTKAKKMAGGGMSAMGALAGTPALIGRPAINAPVQAPGKPSMAARRKAMAPKKPMGMGTPSGPAMPAGNPAMPAMKEGGKSDKAQDKAMIKKAFKQHDSQEHKGGKGTSLKLKKGGKGYASGGAIPSETTSGSYATTLMHQAKKDNASGTGGVKLGNSGGYKKGGKALKMATGGAIPSETTSGSYDTTLMHQAKPDNSRGVTGGVRYGNGGGYKTGGVTESNGGGYRKGGATKKFADGGKVQDDGGPEKMPQGRKPVSQPVEINMLSGAFKNGGKVAPGNKALQASFNKTNAPAMREAKAKSVEAYAPMGSVVRKNRGGMC
jgi:hypothetical protein